MKGSPVSGVTGLSLRDGKSRTLGERISGALDLGDGGAPMASGAIILRFLRLLRRSYSLKDGFLGRHGPLLAAWPLPALAVAAGAVAFLEDCSEPVSIWTTCLKELVSACTKVVGNGVVSIVRGTGLGEGRRLWCGWAWAWAVVRW